MTTRRPSVMIVGAGGLARSLARALGRGGSVEVVVAARRPAAAAAIARGVPRVRAMPRIDEGVAAADVVVIAVPDGAIAAVARSLAPLRRSWRGVVVLHAAGAYGPEPLAVLARRGASTGVLHPLAVLGRSANGRLAGASARIEGSSKARAAARRLAALVGLVPLSGRSLSSPRGRRAYHAAASLASNDLVALLVAARALLVRTGVAKSAATRALASLATGAVAQTLDTGLLGALTGPVARGDVGTVAAQMQALAAADPEAAEAHRALSLRLLAFAEESGRIEPTAARALRKYLARGRRRSATV
jgi:predicted short-subunit dehydrogenase-like oxidoreductase (DUF2520 family)